MTEIRDEEEIARLLFYPQMVRDGELTPSAFPLDELLTKKGKNGASVDRCDLLVDRDALLEQKSGEISNPDGGRKSFGFCVGLTAEVRAIETTVKEKEPESGVETEVKRQALDVWPDEITENDPPKQWDQAHALMKKFDENYTRAHLRGTRDDLVEIFSKQIITF